MNGYIWNFLLDVRFLLHWLLLAALLADTPPGYYEIRSTSGRYASYWNAYLFNICDYFTGTKVNGDLWLNFAVD